MIKFLSPRYDYGCFSNFSRHKIEMDGKVWRTSEHYYQSEKTTDPVLKELIHGCSTPGAAASFGRSMGKLRDDWDQIKYAAMKKTVLAKTEQHADIKDLLLATGDEELVENSKKDYIWGCGADGTGTNWLGQIWMEVREEIRNKLNQDDSSENTGG